MRAVLDTNIVVGAAITPKGPPGEIISAWRRSEFIWLTSVSLLDELARVLAYPRIRPYLAWSDDEISEFLALAQRVAVVTAPQEELSLVARDASDNRVLEAARDGNADYVVTNDNDLLDLPGSQQFEIVTAARFAWVLSRAR